MFIKLTRTDGAPVWLNPDFIVRIEPWKKGSAVAAAGDGDFEVMEDPRTILALAGGVRCGALGERALPTGEQAGRARTPCAPSGESGAGDANVSAPGTAATGETPVVPVRKTRSRKKVTSEPAPEPKPALDPTPEPAPAQEPVPEPTPESANNLFPQPPDEVAVAAAILKKQRCRSRKRIQNTIKSMNPKMSMDAARALLEQMEARGFVLIDAQGHATFT